jgi:hypothetical protein
MALIWIFMVFFLFESWNRVAIVIRSVLCACCRSHRGRFRSISIVLGNVSVDFHRVGERFDLSVRFHRAPLLVGIPDR